MSLHNLATVFGPTLLRPSTAGPGIKQRADQLAAGTVDAMAQAGILYCLLQQRHLAAHLSSHQRAPHNIDWFGEVLLEFMYVQRLLIGQNRAGKYVILIYIRYYMQSDRTLPFVFRSHRKPFGTYLNVVRIWC